MITIRKSEERGRTTHGGWLRSAHTFSFGDYFDLRHQGYGNLRVINDDTVAPARGFGTHGHRDMEIISYVLEGELSHKDSMGNGEASGMNSGIVRPGDVQRMSAGTGVLHSEFNNSPDQPVHFLQIWILPKFKGIRPSYEQKHFPVSERRGQLRLIASPDGAADSVSINADASIKAGLLDEGEVVHQSIDPQRLTYVHLASGQLTVNDYVLREGDGAMLEGESQLHLVDAKAAEVLVFDLKRD